MKNIFLLLTLSTLLIVFPKHLHAHSETIVVEITENGFDPREITLDTGSIINFANKDTKDHWPASDPHPIHNDYSEFDPRKPIPPGEFWIFKPSEAGTWHFHDHLYPHRTGTLTVTSEEASTTQNSSTEEPKQTETDNQSFISRIKTFFNNLFDKIKSPFVKKK